MHAHKNHTCRVFSNFLLLNKNTKKYKNTKKKKISSSRYKNGWKGKRLSGHCVQPIFGVHAYIKRTQTKRKNTAFKNPVKEPLWAEKSLKRRLTWALLTQWLSQTWVLGRPAALRGVAFQVLSLQWLHVILVDFQCGAELYRQPRQDVVTRHQEQGLTINFLSDKDRNSSFP